MIVEIVGFLIITIVLMVISHRNHKSLSELVHTQLSQSEEKMARLTHDVHVSVRKPLVLPYTPTEDAVNAQPRYGLSQKVEYRVIDLIIMEEPANHEKALNEAARQGWRVLSSVDLPGMQRSGVDEIRYVLIRPLTDLQPALQSSTTPDDPVVMETADATSTLDSP